MACSTSCSLRAMAILPRASTPNGNAQPVPKKSLMFHLSNHHSTDGYHLSAGQIHGVIARHCRIAVTCRGLSVDPYRRTGRDDLSSVRRRLLKWAPDRDVRRLIGCRASKRCCRPSHHIYVSTETAVDDSGKWMWYGRRYRNYRRYKNDVDIDRRNPIALFCCRLSHVN